MDIAPSPISAKNQPKIAGKALCAALLKGCGDPELAMAAVEDIRAVGAAKTVAVLGPKIDALTHIIEVQGRELRASLDRLEKIVDAQQRSLDRLRETVVEQGRSINEQRVRTEEMDKRLNSSNKLGIATLSIVGVFMAAVLAFLGQSLTGPSASAPLAPQQPAVQSIPTEDAVPEPGSGTADPPAIGAQASGPATDPG